MGGGFPNALYGAKFFKFYLWYETLDFGASRWNSAGDMVTDGHYDMVFDDNRIILRWGSISIIENSMYKIIWFSGEIIFSFVFDAVPHIDIFKVRLFGTKTQWCLSLVRLYSGSHLCRSGHTENI